MTSLTHTPNTPTSSDDGETKNQSLKYTIEEWDDVNLNLDSNILRGIFAYGFEQPSPIQKKSSLPDDYAR